LQATAQKWVRVNTVGYLPDDIKVAVYISTEPSDEKTFNVCDAVTGKVVYTGQTKAVSGEKWAMASAYRLNFTPVQNEGGYYIECAGAKSPNFKIGADVYEGLSDYMLVYMRQQRCGDNPYNDALCHQHDGYIVDHPTRNGEKIDVRGGWHDATDYLQYQTTSATATYHMMFAYNMIEDKSVFKDEYKANGRKGSNGIPDILDEAKWGLEWLNKMNPEDKVMFAQIADDRDHTHGMRLPNKDSVDYGWGPGLGRPVYFVTGKPQGLGKWINRTTGVASVAGKFSSTFALGAKLFKDIDPKLANVMQIKATQAFAFGEEFPGNTQTACLVSPYFYEEDSYVDDLELAAATLAEFTGMPEWKKKADYWGDLEPVTPWMETGRRGEYHHYQWYPFINLGHFLQSRSADEKVAKKYQRFMKLGLEMLQKRGADDPFMHGVPYLWCSNNLTSAAVSYARLYNISSGDSTFVEMEMALRDWLLGCNPWGTTMIVGYPEIADYPKYPHSSYLVVWNDITPGGLIDGPIQKDLFEERAGGSLTKPDEYAVFNNGEAVYHDDLGDYASNEPTMDGSAGLTYYFSAMAEMGRKQKSLNVEKDAYDCVVRINPDKKDIYLVFTADSLFQGAETIVKTLKKKKIKGSFFFTGNALRLEEHKDMIEKIIKDGHYVGGHSDSHMLYAEWSNRDSLIVTYDQILEDIKANAKELEKFGVTKQNSSWFLPPYEYYNRESVQLTESLGYKVLNYTPGTATPADYTTPSMKSYKSSQQLIDKLYAFEKQNGLNGAIILIHPGVAEERTDRLYNRLGEIIEEMKLRGYSFKSLNEIE
jgi:peptidoglycan/xylan/chitin deacetylase (PgdA/CDA1 family)